LAVKPQVLLLDEPLSALDAKIRVSLREEIRAIQRQLGITTVFVTHDQEEALSISDRIVVMNAGKADQIGTPFDIYNRPQTRFVASFVGTLSILDAKVADPASNKVDVAGKIFAIGDSLASRKPGDTVSLALRPEALSINAEEGRDASLSGRDASVSFLGSVIRVRLDVDGQPVSLDMFNSPGYRPPSIGEVVEARFASSDVLLIGQ
jgi:putative spermidine/putrescine transport system ATP-binding protein